MDLERRTMGPRVAKIPELIERYRASVIVASYEHDWILEAAEAGPAWGFIQSIIRDEGLAGLSHDA